jgi:Ca2+-binding EF-hand superfamily protein
MENSFDYSLIWLDQTPEEIFDELDLTGNNLLSRKELSIALSVRGIPVTKKLLDSIFDTCDISKEGTISKEEFIIYTKHQFQNLKKIFNEIDISKDKKVSFYELKKAILKVNQSYSDREIEYLMSRLDTDQNQKVDLSDFMKFYHLIPVHDSKMSFDLFSREYLDLGESFLVSEDQTGNLAFNVEDQQVK